MSADNRYMARGVSASKEDVHNAIKNIDKGLYPKAFCKIIPDIFGEIWVLLLATGKKLGITDIPKFEAQLSETQYFLEG